MRRSAWIFLAAIFLPSLGLAWLAVHSVRDQQVVLEHQEAIICQNITDALAKNLQGRMDQARGDFVQTTQQLLSESSSSQILAKDFNRKLREAWPMAEIGFAVDLDGEIYSPKAYDGPEEKTFRDENDRFLSNRENVVVYSSNSMTPTQNGSLWQNGSTNQSNFAAQNNLKKLTFASRDQFANASADKEEIKTGQAENGAKAVKSQPSPPQAAKDEDLDAGKQEAATDAIPAGGAAQETFRPTATAALAGRAAQAPDLDQNTPASSITAAASASSTGAAAAPSMPESSISDSTKVASGMPAPAAATPPMQESAMSSAGKMIPAAPSSAPAFNLAVPAIAGKEPAAATASPESETAAATPPPQNAAPSSSGELDGMVQPFAKIQRQVLPQQNVSQLTAPLSNTVPEESDFQRLIGAGTSGALARFLENKLRLMVWSHPAADTPIVFGAQLDQGKLIEALKTSFQIPELAQGGSSLSSGSDYCAAILDDTGHPVALSRPGFTGDWKHPFVATEIGEALPHWEAALYLVDPQQISRAARTLQATLGLIVLLLVAAIVSGGSLIAADVRRQVRLAQQKTDFVSNVSHELKTPLTSIRMFADLLAEKRVPDEEKQSTYLRIIAAEAARLTRLINNVLDFARLERGAPGDVSPGEQGACDLVDAVRDVVETCRPHLEVAGVSFQSEIEAETLPITGDRDALAQIILNLLSNAEKYGGNDVRVRVRRQETPAGALGCVDVLDRGPGIPPRQVKTVFEPFHRLDDSLSSGIPGSGLGLTLARRMARAHGGDVTYSPRAGGGSCFTLSVPLKKNPSS